MNCSNADHETNLRDLRERIQRLLQEQAQKERKRQRKRLGIDVLERDWERKR